MFKFILKENTHTNPLIYVSGVKSADLGFILDYIYDGEVNLYEGQLQSFLKTAGKLEVLGVYNQETKEEVKAVQYYQEEDTSKTTIEDEAPLENIKIIKATSGNELTTNYVRGKLNIEKKIDASSMNPIEIEDMILGLCQKGNGVWMCLACEEYTNHKRAKVRRHIESHINGFSFTCTFCFKDFRTKNSMQAHISLTHRTDVL